MKEKSFNPHVRFFKRRSLAASYAYPVLAYDHRLLYTSKGFFSVELGEGCIPMHAGSLLIIPPGIAYRLLKGAEETEFFIVNFDFDSEHCEAVARAPVGESDFSAYDIFSKSSISPFETVLYLESVYVAELLLTEMDGGTGADELTLARMRSGLMKYLLAKAAYLATAPRTAEDPLVLRIKEYVEANYAKTINNKTVAMEMCYHPYYIGTRFLKSEGTTLHAYIESVRLTHAKEMLMQSQMPISSVARACGFAEPSYFVKFFFRHMGMTPKQYRGLCM